MFFTSIVISCRTKVVLASSSARNRCRILLSKLLNANVFQVKTSPKVLLDIVNLAFWGVIGRRNCLDLSKMFNMFFSVLYGVLTRILSVYCSYSLHWEFLRKWLVVAHFNKFSSTSSYSASIQLSFYFSIPSL